MPIISDRNDLIKVTVFLKFVEVFVRFAANWTVCVPFHFFFIFVDDVVMVYIDQSVDAKPPKLVGDDVVGLRGKINAVNKRSAVY